MDRKVMSKIGTNYKDINKEKYKTLPKDLKKKQKFCMNQIRIFESKSTKINRFF